MKPIVSHAQQRLLTIELERPEKRNIGCLGLCLAHLEGGARRVSQRSAYMTVAATGERQRAYEVMPA